MKTKTFLQKILFVGACSYSLVIGSSFATDLKEQDINAKSLVTPSTVKPQSSGNETTVDVSPGGISILKSTTASEDGKGNATEEVDVRGTPVLKTSVNKDKPV